MYRSVVPAIVPGVAPGTLISVGSVAISFDTGIPACPAGHAPDTHAAAEVAPGVEFVPTGHATHAVDEFAPVTAENVPTGQLVHTAAPTVLLKLPAAHDAHAPPSGPVEPALHVQKPSPALTVLYNAVISAGVSTLLYI